MVTIGRIVNEHDLYKSTVVCFEADFLAQTLPELLSKSAQSSPQYVINPGNSVLQVAAAFSERLQSHPGERILHLRLQELALALAQAGVHENVAERRSDYLAINRVLTAAMDDMQDRLARDYAQSLCDSGTDLTFLVYPGEEHSGPMNVGRADFTAWVAKRFGGEPATNNCRELR